MPEPPTPVPDPIGRPPVPRRRRWLKRFARGCGICTLLFVCWQAAERAWAKNEGQRAVREALADVEGTDPDWTWERLNANRKKPPAGHNSAEVIPKIHALIHPDWGKWQIDLELLRQNTAVSNVRFPEPVLREVRRDLAASADAVRLARTLKDLPHGYRDIVLAEVPTLTFVEDTQKTRRVEDLLRWEVVLALEVGNDARAADALHALLNAARSVGDEPYIFSQLIRFASQSVTISCAERAVAQSARFPRLAELQAAIAGATEEQTLLPALRGERAIYDLVFQKVEAGSIALFEAANVLPGEWWKRKSWEYAYGAQRSADRAFSLRTMTRYVELARLPLHEQPAQFARHPRPARYRDRLLSSLFIPDVPAIANAQWRTTAEGRCAVAGIACERFRQQHGRWPASLAELVPAFLPAVPIDPYTAEPLRFTKLEQGVVIHSVGKELRGDGGTLDAPPSPTVTYSRFRLWNPELRRQPAPPEPPAADREPQNDGP